MATLDWFNRKPEPQEPLVAQAPIQTAYLEFLLERLCWLAAPGNLEFPEYQKVIRKDYAARLQRDEEDS